tara:strand:- start:6459 stop:6911 length:453 start_codon:yes stop_codon:yes gene_type:complete
MTTVAETKKYKREVYRNLHKCGVVYSVRKDGLVEGYADLVSLYKPVFAVGSKGNQRVRNERRKNVHAYARGYISDVVWHDESNAEFSAAHAKIKFDEFKNLDYPDYEWKQIIYDPYKYKTFVLKDSGQPIFNACHVLICKKVWALTLKES